MTTSTRQRAALTEGSRLTPAHDLLQYTIRATAGRHHGENPDPVGVLAMGTIEATQVDTTCTESLQQQRSHLRFRVSGNSSHPDGNHNG